MPMRSQEAPRDELLRVKDSKRPDISVNDRLLIIGGINVFDIVGFTSFIRFYFPFLQNRNKLP
jgi:hypothetical protein